MKFIMRDECGFSTLFGAIVHTAFVVSVGFGVLFSVIVLSYDYEKSVCERTSEVMEVDYKYEKLTCFIEYDAGKWIPLNNYRVTE